MNYGEFHVWLQKDKGMIERSAKDTVSRLKRALRIISEDSVNEKTLTKLNGTKEFLNIPQCCRSQLRRSVTLYQEFGNASSQSKEG